MPIPIRPREPSASDTYLIETTDDGSRTLIRRDDDVRFHSGCGAAAECDHVYIGGGEPCWNPNGETSILEIGFGTGMAMLRTVDQFLHRGGTGTLRCVSIERAPVPAEVLAKLRLQHGLDDQTLASRFIQWWAGVDWELARQATRQATWQADDRCQVTVHREEANRWLAANEETFDVVYFDPFDPTINPGLWQVETYAMLYRSLRPGGRLMTYCVRGHVRRELAWVGFIAEVVDGPPGGKREVLIASRPMS